MKNKILLVGGGTGGHIVPVYNIAERLREKNKELDLYIVGNGSVIEKDFYGKCENYFILRTGRFDRHSILNNLWQTVLFVSGMVQAFLLLQKIKPKLIFAKGGFVSYPIVFWARLLHIPYFIHESDIVMGNANRYAAKSAQKVFVGFPKKYYKDIPDSKLVYAGQIIFDPIVRKDYFDFGFSDSKPVIFVTGGSLGAKSINKKIYKLLPEILKSYNIIHQVGAKNYQEAISVRSTLRDNMKKSYFISGFLVSGAGENLVPSALERADLVIARAGATTIAEIARAEKPMILLPYSYASNKHQELNAMALKKANACIVLDESALTAETLWKTITKTLEDKSGMKEMVKAARDFFPENGVQIVCDEIIKEVEK